MAEYLSQKAKDEMPRRPKNGYMLYKDEVYEDIKKKNSEKSMTELT